MSLGTALTYKFNRELSAQGRVPLRPVALQRRRRRLQRQRLPGRVEVAALTRHRARPCLQDGRDDRYRRRRTEGAALDRAALGARQRAAFGRHRLGPAALVLSERRLRHRGRRRFRRDPRARQEIRRHRAGLRQHRAPPRGQGARRRGGRLAGHRARQLFHGGDPLGLGAMVALRQRCDESRLQQEQARLLHALCARWPITGSSR